MIYPILPPELARRLMVRLRILSFANSEKGALSFCASRHRPVPTQLLRTLKTSGQMVPSGPYRRALAERSTWCLKKP